MPTYEYECNDCHATFSKLESITEHTRARPTCPECKSKNVSQVLVPFYAKTIRKS